MLIANYVDSHYQLTQKEYITLGIIASKKKLLSTHLTTLLQLNQEDRMRTWIGSLLENQILITQGERKGTHYLLNPKLFEQAKLDITPSLKTMEPYILEALIKEDLKYNGISSISEINKRIEGVSEKDIQKTIYKMTKSGDLEPSGAKKNRTYELVKKK